MTTSTLTVNALDPALIRRVAARERTDETRDATRLLEWAATRRGDDGETDTKPALTNDGSDWDDKESRPPTARRSVPLGFTVSPTLQIGTTRRLFLPATA